MPKEIAVDFILNNENYNRSYYTGYLGELQLNKCTNLFVNLRCLNYKNDKLGIYVGGGITLASDPLKEWEETVVKAQVMKKVLSVKC